MAAQDSWTRVPLETAAAYLELGLSILPECPPTCPTCAPQSKGKVPWDPLTGRHMAVWQQRGAPTVKDLDAWLDAEAVRLASGTAPANIGCRCGPGCLGADGLIGADADGSRGIADIAGHLGLAPGMLEAALAEYRETGIFRLNLGGAAYVTPSGGLRVLWQVPCGAQLKTVGGDKNHDGLGLFWGGKQIVLPSSATPAGEYRWLPGHSPWQIGIAPAPTSVLTAMRGHGEASKPIVVVTPSDTYPACVGNLGPDRDGRLVHASWLPYDQHLLREGVPEGQRSEAVRRLELQMLSDGWSAVQVAAALAGQPWVQAMRPNVAAWLGADVARAIAWLADQQPTRDGEANRGNVEPVSGYPEAEHVLATTDSAGSASRVEYARSEHGTRMRTFSVERDSAVRAGIALIEESVQGLPHPTETQERLGEHCARLLGGYDRCRTEAWAHPHDLRDAVRLDGVGLAWLWSKMPCDGRGHEACAPFHALRELEAQWGPALHELYGALPVAVLALAAPGWGLQATRDAAAAVLRRTKIAHTLGPCAGFLIFEPGDAPGYAFHVIVPAHRADKLRPILLKEWRDKVPCGWLRTVENLPAGPTAMEALVELRVRSEQALLLALGRGEVERDRGMHLYAVEIGAVSGSKRGGQLHRLVVAPGMRTLAKLIRDGQQQRMDKAVGDGIWGGDAPTGLGGQAVEGTSPLIAGMGSDSDTGAESAGQCAIPSNRGTESGSPCAAGDSGTSAPSDDEGWVPCPWDPTLQMRPARGKDVTQALPWWKLQKMAARGEVVPIVHNGRVIAYRTPPTRGGTA